MKQHRLTYLVRLGLPPTIQARREASVPVRAQLTRLRFGLVFASPRLRETPFTQPTAIEAYESEPNSGTVETSEFAAFAFLPHALHWLDTR